MTATLSSDVKTVFGQAMEKPHAHNLQLPLQVIAIFKVAYHTYSTGLKIIHLFQLGCPVKKDFIGLPIMVQIYNQCSWYQFFVRIICENKTTSDISMMKLQY